MKRVTLNRLISMSLCQLVLACTSAPASQVNAIIGQDNRQPEDRSLYLETIGRINIGETTCNAFASGENEITTAAHCMALDTVPEVSEISFTAANGQRYEVSDIELLDARKDLARLVTKTAFGRWLERASLQGGGLTLVAVDPTSGSLLSDRSCSLEQERPAAGVFLHSCDTVPGESGAPVLQDGKYVGVHLGYKALVDRNVAFDITKDQDETVDVLSLEYKKEGCHSRVHIRGRHSRGHVRDCTPEVPAPDFSWAISAVAKPISDQLSAQARNDGWTTGTCTAVAAGAVGAISAGYGAAICAAANVAAPACVAFLAASGPAIVAATCAQLCTDRHLADCR